MMQRWIDFGLNLGLSTIPETMFFVIMTYVLLNRIDLFDIDIRRIKFTLKNILIPVLPISVLMDFFRCIAPNQYFIKVICLIVLYIILIIWIKKNTYRYVHFYELKIGFCLLISFMFITSIETIYMMFMSLFIKDLMYFQLGLIHMLILSIPIRIVEATIVSTLYIKKNNFKNISILSNMLKNKNVLLINILILFFNSIVILMFLKLVVYNQILASVSLHEQIIIISLIVIVLPCISLLSSCYVFRFLTVYQKQIQQSYQKSDSF